MASDEHTTDQQSSGNAPEAQAHAEKVKGTLRTLEEKFGKKFSDEEQRVLEAIVRHNPDGVQRILDDVKAGEDWYYEEFIKHPQIAAMIQELSIMGL
jgi:hypothetical protein